MTDTKELVRRAGELADSEQPDEAMEICNRVLLTEPDHPGALYVAGCVLLTAGRHVQALQFAKRIAEICPRDPRGWGLQALIVGELHRYDESIRCADKALACRRSPKTLADAAYARVNAGEWDAALKLADESLKTSDDSTPESTTRDAKVHRMYALLGRGEWARGFADYRLTMRTKWRKEWAYIGPDGQPTREWMGEPDAVVMVTGEQGLGDEIMACSVVPDAARACKTFILDCDHRLVDLLRRSFPGVIVTATRRDKSVSLPIAPTHHKSLFGLCELFRKRDEDFPAKPFLLPNAAYVQMFRDFLQVPTVGLAWSGGLLRTGMEQRAAGLSAFLPLVRRGDAQFVSLQYHDDRAEVAEFERQHGIKVLRLPWVTCGPDMDLLAGLIASLKEVIGVHTTALHIAGAMGVPTTVLAHRGSGWRYGDKGLPWYGSAKMFRKRPGESWRDCVGRLVESRK